jgi:hypothetical protein
MVQAVVGEALGPILEWQSDATDPAERMASLIKETFPRISENEPTFRAALRLSLEQQDAAEPDTSENFSKKDFARGHRIDLLDRVLAPLKDHCSADEYKNLSQALSMVFGIEGMIVLKDIWGADNGATEDIAIWAARRLIDATVSKGGKPHT